MIHAAELTAALRRRGLGFFSGVPCSYLKPLINHVINDPALHYVAAANEGDAVALAAGAHLAGGGGVVLCQNSGLGNAVNPLTSLTHTFRIPVLLIVTLRGAPGGPPDEPQHDLMGSITTRMLEVMEIPWAFFPAESSEIEPTLARAMSHMDRERRPFALVMRKGAVAPEALEAPAPPRPLAATPLAPARGGGALAGEPRATRREMLAAFLSARRPNDIAVASTGFTGRELYALEDRPDQLYMVGSMGCAVGFGAGMALTLASRGALTARVVVLDGDGALLMRLGVLATVGYERPANLVHVVLDNGCHESTGGQSTNSFSVALPAIAAACGYREAREIYAPEDFAAALDSDESGPRLLRLPIRPGYPESLPRPTVTPEQVARRLEQHLQGMVRGAR